MKKEVIFYYRILKTILKTMSTIHFFKSARKSKTMRETNLKINLEKKDWSTFILKTTKIKTTLHNFKNINKNTKKLYIINHRSMLDIPIIEQSLSVYENNNWIAKKELFDIKIFGDFFKYSKTLSIDRENKRSIIQLLKDIKSRLSETQHETFAMFPEGTRNKTEIDLLEFKDGAVLIAKKNNLEIVPIYIKERTDLIEQSLLDNEWKDVNIFVGKPLNIEIDLQTQYQSFINEYK